VRYYQVDILKFWHLLLVSDPTFVTQEVDLEAGVVASVHTTEQVGTEGHDHDPIQGA
jgi:hypothetical protein